MILDELQTLDERITLTINSLHFEAGDHFWQFFSSAEVWFPLYAAVIFVMFRRLGWKKGLMSVAAMVLTLIACDQIAGLVPDQIAGPVPFCEDTFPLCLVRHETRPVGAVAVRHRQIQNDVIFVRIERE